MAFSTPSESPAVVVREIDLTGGVPNVQSTTGAVVGNFRWGPVLQRVLVANETELVDNFASPSDSNSVDFLTASQFLRYSSALQVVRNIDSDGFGNECASAISLQGTTGSNPDSNGSVTGLDNPLVLNQPNFEARQSSLEAALDSAGAVGYGFIAKYPGALGSSLKVSYLPAVDSSSETPFTNWAYSSEFDASPRSSVWASSKGSRNDEMHLVVIDEDGQFTGTRGSILERFSNLSVLTDAKNTEGQSIYAKEVVNTQSEYVYLVNFDTELEAKGAGTASTTNTNYALDSNVDRNHSLASGRNSGALSTGAILSAQDLFEDKDQVEVDFLIAPDANVAADKQTIVNDLVATAQSLRKDCVVVTSPNRNAVVGVVSDATKVSNTVTTVGGFTKSSYLVVDNNFLKVYDKYNDKYVEIPAASTVAGIMAATDFNRAPWFSPAGSRRGQMLGITSLNYSPTKGQRDTLYKAGVNPIANIPGQGALLFGDKTFLGRPSAFDRINVRRLFLVLERAIGRAAEQVLFEFNDEFTRAEFVNIVEPVLREVQGRRGITDFRVVCDETNNTAAVVDRNEFKADIFIKPARSINYVTLSFVAVRTGVDFEEVVGTV
jgi:phage tail sheath protein FI